MFFIFNLDLIYNDNESDDNEIYVDESVDDECDDDDDESGGESDDDDESDDGESKSVSRSPPTSDDLMNENVESSSMSCPTCGRKFLYHSWYLRHLASHQPGLYPCTKCPKVLKSIGSLHRHNQTHIQRRRKMFQCKACEQKYFYRHDAIKHYQNKHTSTIFECDLCKKIMALSSLRK